MTNTDDISEKDLQSGEFITGPMLKYLFLAGALWPERSLSSPLTVAWRCVRDEISRCSSDSAGDIFKAVERGANRTAWSKIHPNVTFFRWFHFLATALSDNQQISAQDFARAIYKAADNQSGTIQRKIADAGMRIATTTPNIYELFDRVLGESRLAFAKKRQDGDNLIILFLEGMQCYIRGNISLSDIEEIGLSKSRKLELNEVKEENSNQWIYHAVALLDATVSSETNNAEVLIATLKVRELIHANYDNIPKKQTLDELDKLLINLVTIYAPKSHQLALRIRDKISNPDSSEGDLIS